MVVQNCLFELCFDNTLLTYQRIANVFLSLNLFKSQSCCLHQPCLVLFQIWFSKPDGYLQSSDTANHSASEKFPLEDYDDDDGGDGEDVDDDSDNGAYVI